MPRIVVYHPPDLESNHSYTEFSGEEVAAITMQDGSLHITKWQTDTERGFAIFARGGWISVCVSNPIDTT